jgi:hypothetical protein
MKTIKMIIVVFLFIGCSNSKKEKEQISNVESEKNANELISHLTKYAIENDTEKIALLSIMHGIDKDTIKYILTDYSTATQEFNYEKKQKLDFIKIIDSISTKYKINKKEAAKVISDYQYKFKEESNSEESNSEESSYEE